MELLIERLTWTDVEAALGRGMRRAIVCAASTEQHGPHPPEATDALLGEAYAEGLARRLGDGLVAPVIRPACSDHHMAFPRTDSDGPHADVLETSMMLHLHPELVNMDRAGAGFTGRSTLDDVLTRGMRAITPNGILGDPVGATAEMGAAVLDAIVGRLTELVRAAATG
jgi:creatinine amidohydrolase/Fe(II)-dependent formamide hydrolase-like protein